MDALIVSLVSVWNDSGFQALTGGNVIMILVGLILLYLAIGKGFEPLLLGNIAFGCILGNVPKTGFFEDPGVMQVILYGINNEIFPPLIFMGVGAMTDFGPLIANPKTLLLGAAAQGGVFIALVGAMLLGFNLREAAAIGIIGGADGPTAIYLTMKMAPNLLGAIAVAAYSYMSLVPLIQPPVMNLLTTKEQRSIKMDQLRTVTRFVTIFLSVGTGLTMQADKFLNYQTLLIICLGLVAFIAGTALGVIFGQLMRIASGNKVNPLIGSAGVSAVPMAARVAQVVGQKANPANFLLMHAMGPNVAGVIGTAVAAGTMLAMIGPAGK